MSYVDTQREMFPMRKLKMINKGHWTATIDGFLVGAEYADDGWYSWFRLDGYWHQWFDDSGNPDLNPLKPQWKTRDIALYKAREHAYNAALSKSCSNIPV